MPLPLLPLVTGFFSKNSVKIVLGALLVVSMLGLYWYIDSLKKSIKEYKEKTQELIIEREKNKLLYEININTLKSSIDIQNNEIEMLRNNLETKTKEFEKTSNNIKTEYRDKIKEIQVYLPSEECSILQRIIDEELK